MYILYFTFNYLLNCFLFPLVLCSKVCFGVSAQGVLLGAKKDEGISDKCCPTSISEFQHFQIDIQFLIFK